MLVEVERDSEIRASFDFADKHVPNALHPMMHARDCPLNWYSCMENGHTCCCSRCCVIDLKSLLSMFYYVLLFVQVVPFLPQWLRNDLLSPKPISKGC